MADKPQYAKPASQVDLEERLKNGNRSQAILSTADSFEPAKPGEERSYAVEGNKLDGYVGVSGEYATYANETEAPLAGKGVEQDVLESFGESYAGAKPGATEASEVEEEEKEKETPKPSPAPKPNTTTN